MSENRPAFVLHARSFLRLIACASVVLPGAIATGNAQQTMSFTCGPSHADVAQLTTTTTFRAGTPNPFGFDLGTAPQTVSGGVCSSDRPFFFSIPATDGTYEVTVELGGRLPSTTTIRAESRRLMVQQESVAAGKVRRQTFMVNVRTPPIHDPLQPDATSDHLQTVKLKPRELGALDWDNKLTLEFNGVHPSVRSIAIRKTNSIPTIYLAGDSTVVDQDKEPWAAWGQMLPRFFNDRISIANHAESGETIRSFVAERRLAKIMSTIKPGDYLFVQFAHNDQKPGSGFVSIADYWSLLESYIKQTRDHGATPILVTSMNRRKFDEAGHIIPTLGEYPEATREVAKEQQVALLDLNAMSKTLFEAMGEAGTLKAFVHYPANTFPGQEEELKDDTHFNSYGAYELARCIVQSIRDQRLPLAAFLMRDTPRFDPAHPDPVESWSLPASPMISTDTPYGR